MTKIPQTETSKFKYKVNLHLHYFDVGMARLSLLRYVWLFMGFGTISAGMSWLYAIYIGVVYAIVCYLFGLFWFRFGWFTASIEVGNQFNLFVKEMRKVYKR